MPPLAARSDAEKRNFAFLESYFSNFIEGTEFDVEEARSIVLDGASVDHRPKDSHDILGVFEQALSPQWATLTLAQGESVIDQLRARHRHQMQWRPETSPGEFKTRSNRAGNTEFVDPQLVRGTLIEGSRLLASVPAGTAQALFSMFLIAEVHPFTDGNGRLARLVMNSTLSAADGCRIIVPTLFREEYLDCLRELTRNADAKPFLKAMTGIHEWTASFDYSDLDDVVASMKECNAFERSRNQFQLLLPADKPPGNQHYFKPA
jgi:Fic family protein